MTKNILPNNTLVIKICSVSDCERKVLSKGFCCLHYSRMHRNGTLESKYRTTCKVENCNGKHKAKGYCLKHYERFKNHGNTELLKNIPVGNTPEEKFWSKVQKTESCWNWTGNLNHNGYGRMSFNGKSTLTHRISWYLATGKFPTLFILHSCDNPRCVNPSHLREGTQKENIQDMYSRNRQKKPKNYIP